MAINAPEGTRDLLPDEALFWNQFKQTAAEVFGAYGYLPIETPIMEQTELFVRGIGEATDVVSKEMFTAISGENLRRWVEEGKAPKAKSRLSLRPEGTAGVVRAVVQHDLVPQGAAPAKLMYAGPMFRAERRRGVSASSIRWVWSAWAPRSLRSMPRPSSCSCAFTRRRASRAIPCAFC